MTKQIPIEPLEEKIADFRNRASYAAIYGGVASRIYARCADELQAIVDSDKEAINE